MTIRDWKRKVIALFNKPNKNQVKTKQWFIVDKDHHLVGCIDCRYRLLPYHELEGGHIGYSIRPSDRGKGYADQGLKLALTYAKNEVGLSHCLLTCDETNTVSRHIIRQNKGELKQVITLNKRKIEHYEIFLH